jgi:hypothetical protein
MKKIISVLKRVDWYFTLTWTVIMILTYIFWYYTISFFINL